uniref:Valine--tRNA ligase, mitochondrial n=1 Tax=Parastrongyloides trichosuri TaxID=131310 RepID=A0A0N4Z0P1_PARTI
MTQNEKPKTPAQLKKEAAKREKLAKFEEKQKKLEAIKKTTTVGDKKSKSKGNKENPVYIPEHPLGEKKSTNVPLPNAYSPGYVETAWYEWWEKEGFFKPEYNETPDQETFTICIPPPNVTGTLHLGHALASSVEDSVTRYHRMLGKKVLFNPGCDHAGIATQVVVEKKLKREKGLSRHDLGREKFLEEVWKWKNEKGHIIYEQFKKMGTSVDWDRAVFMMDPKIQRTVTEAFVRMHESGTIYRSNRLVNWSCSLRSAISDIEVDKVEISGKTLLSIPGYKDKIEFGVLVSFAYPIIDSSEQIVVATTRIETMLGDVAVAVHPEDDRYKHLVGKKIKHPFIENRELTIISDSFVEREFGTGCVKITPAHDPTDYEVGVRHKLPMINILNDEGEMNEECGKFSGMKRFDARKAVMEELEKLGLLKEVRDNPMVVPICSRSKDVIEPRLKSQWFVKCSDMAKKAIDAVKNGELKLIPDFHVSTWNRWLGDIRDWCISRQLWWGHRIPAYYVTFKEDCGVKNGDPSNNDYWVSAKSEIEALEKASKKFNLPKDKINLEWDEDVLDTWFSSGLWPFSVMGWPENTSDMKKFFPGALLETGHDILFFWVARMVFLSQELTGQLPFKEVYLHAMIRDCHGRKMSKSLGNIIDPLHVIKGITLAELNAELATGNLDPKELEKAQKGQCNDYPNGIPECGTDALRFSLMAYTSQGRDINLDVLRVQGYRFFCNKIWQAVKFSLMNIGDAFKPTELNKLIIGDCIINKWILSRLSKSVEGVNSGFETYNFQKATTAIYNFWLYDLCDIYLESIKPIMFGDNEEAKNRIRNILFWCVNTGLKLSAPFMPFITEELWQRLPKSESEKSPSIHVSKFPINEDYKFEDSTSENIVNSAMDIVKKIRSLRSDYIMTTKDKIDTYIHCHDSTRFNELNSVQLLIKTLTSSTETIIYEDKTKITLPNECIDVPSLDNISLCINLKGFVPKTAEK